MKTLILTLLALSLSAGELQICPLKTNIFGNEVRSTVKIWQDGNYFNVKVYSMEDGCVWFEDKNREDIVLCGTFGINRKCK